ncbi:Arm DNA-binding domain-containing protein [Psychromonas hadalis]|uniref:Arm DNA-binding domain-containing protein n=1 Tax=Psychromonas hadalis TaxID=211669 RepID=UPI0003B31F65|nr:DUF3596 domain-containing protein [Psychromonas hadalis]
MGNISARSNKLVLEFRAQGIRCREQTKLSDTPVNRKRLEKLLKVMEAEIMLDTFDFCKYFPTSKRAAKFAEIKQRKQTASHYFSSANAPRYCQLNEI